MSEIYLILILRGYLLGKARHSLGTQICWKNYNLNHSKIKQSKKFDIKLPLSLSLWLEVVKNSLDWWRMKKHQCPTLARLARKCLCVPGTSIQAEGVFSCIGASQQKEAENVWGECVPATVPERYLLWTVWYFLIESCICIMLYNRDKEKVIIGVLSDTATWYLVLAR